MKKLRIGSLYVSFGAACLVVGMLFFSGCKNLKKSKSVTKTEQKETSSTQADEQRTDIRATSADVVTSSISHDHSETTVSVKGPAIIHPDGKIETTSPETTVQTTTKNKIAEVVTEAEHSKDSTASTEQINTQQSTVNSQKATEKAVNVERKPPYVLYISLIVVMIGLGLVVWKYRSKIKQWLP